MKHSINKIFKNLNTFLLALVVLGFVSSILIIEQYFSYNKIELLTNQSNTIETLLNEQKDLKSVDILQFNSKIAKVQTDIEKLHNQSGYNYISNYINDNEEIYLKDLNKLDALVNSFDRHSRNYIDFPLEDEKAEEYYRKIKSIHTSIVTLVENMMLKNISSDNIRFNILYKIYFTMFIVLIAVTFWYRNRLKNIYNDILFLYSMDSKKNKMDIFSEEADAISLRMKRKSTLNDNPAMMDAVTEIYNNKGMLQSYTEKKGLKDSNFVSVTVLEIDNFSKSKRLFSQDFTQEILKKVAYTISLHEQVTDTIARTDYNQFTLILSRSTKEQSFKDIELVRQSVSEIKMVTPDKETINITVTGGFLIKSNNASLEESIRKAKDLLQNARKENKNKILQSGDLPK